MGPKLTTPQIGALFKRSLAEQIYMRHPLVQLRALIDWLALERSLSENFTSRRAARQRVPS